MSRYLDNALKNTMCIKMWFYLLLIIIKLCHDLLILKYPQLIFVPLWLIIISLVFFQISEIVHAIQTRLKYE